MKNKLFNIIFAVIVMANSNAFAQTDSDKGLIAQIADALFSEDCDNCPLPASEQVAKICKTLNDYIFLLKLDLPPATPANLRSDFLNHSEIILGEDIKCPMLDYRQDPYGYGFKLKPYYPRSKEQFIVYSKISGLPYIKVDLSGTQKVPKAILVVSDISPLVRESFKPVAPPIVQAPKAQPPLAPTPTVSAKAPIVGDYYYNNVVNSYNTSSSSGHNCVGKGCTNPGCVDIAREVYPIGAFAGQPKTYGVPSYGNSGVTLSLVLWGGNQYYYQDDWWWSYNSRRRVCNNDYYSLCQTFPKQSNYNPSPTFSNSSGQTANYNGPRKTAGTYETNGSNSGGGYHSSGQPKTFGVR